VSGDQAVGLAYDFVTKQNHSSARSRELTAMNATPILPGLSPVGAKALTATFDAGRLSSDGGLIVLREAARQLGLAEVITAPLCDARERKRVVHTYADMALARMLMISAGYEDCDDIDALRADPALKLACGRCPESGADLMSQPTLSRLENLAQGRALARIGMGLIDLFCRSFAHTPDRIVLDIDDTEDAVHGSQQLALFNAHYDGYCFQPIVIFEATSGKPVAFVLRPGKRPSGEEAARVLRHVIRRIRRRWPRVEILVRGAGHYGCEAVMAKLEQTGCDYILGLPTKVRLDAIAGPWRGLCEMRRKPREGKVRRFYQFQHRAGTWSRTRSVIARVEATALGSDARFLVTSLNGSGKVLYEKTYCARGRMENLIKDLKLYTRADKTACHRWEANQFRLFLHMGAYWLLHTLRRAAPRRSIWRGATFETLRRCFIKVAVRVEEMKSRIRIAFPASYPHAAMLVAMTGTITTAGP
jgi:hypothetical protein